MGRQERQKRKREELERRTADILVLEQEFTVDKKTDYQYRIDSFIDLYPVTRSFHNLITQERGNYPKGDIEPFIYKERDRLPNKQCSCGGFFVDRINKANGNKFLGCTNYPKCTKTKSI